MDALLKELVDRVQRLEENELLKKLDARLCRLEEQLQEQTLMLQRTLPSPKLEERLSEMKEQLEDQTDHVTEQLETKLRRLERRLEDRNNLLKWELLAELMIIEQNLPLAEASRTVQFIAQETQTPEERPDISRAEVQIGELPGTVNDVGVQVHLLPMEEEKRWEVCGERRIRRAICRRESAVVLGTDGIVEFYSSGKMVGRYLELEGRNAWDMFCSDEYIGVWLHNRSVACFEWFSDRLEWLYCLYVEGETWRRAKRTSDVPSQIKGFKYRQAQDVVCCLYGNHVSGWSLSEDKNVFNIKVPGAEYLSTTPDLVLVEVRTGRIKVFDLKGSNLYNIRSKGNLSSDPTPLDNTYYTALVSKESTFTFPTLSGQPVTKIAAFHSALHPRLPHICSSVQGKTWELVLRDVSTDSVVWRRPQSDPIIQVFSIDSELLLIKPHEAPAQTLRWASGELVATLPVSDIKIASPRYIISDDQVLYATKTWH